MFRTMFYHTLLATTPPPAPRWEGSDAGRWEGEDAGRAFRQAERVYDEIQDAWQAIQRLTRERDAALAKAAEYRHAFDEVIEAARDCNPDWGMM